MGIVLSISTEPEFLRVIAEGEFELEAAKENFIEILEAVARYRSEKVLLDGRALSGEMTTMERFYYGEFVAQAIAGSRERGIARLPKFAYVLKQPILDPRRLAETVAVNRGVEMRFFDNFSDALTWLGVEPTEKSNE